MNLHSIFSRNLFASLFLFSQLLLSCSPKSEVVQTKQIYSKDHNRRLLVIENAFYTENKKLYSYPHLVAYNFEEGELVYKDTLTDKTADLYDFQDYGNVNSSIYKNRYILSPLGGTLFDIQTKTILLKDGGSLVESIGDSLIFHLQRFETDTYYLYNLKTHTCTKLKNGSYIEVNGILSPDRKHGFKTYWGQREYPITKHLRLLLYDSTNKEITIVGAGGMGTYLSHGSSDIAEIPAYWLDNSTFIYAKYLFPPVNDATTIEMRKVNLHDKSDEKLCVIDTVKDAGGNARFYKDAAGNLIFEHDDIPYRFNKEMNQISQLHPEQKTLFVSLGHNFECELPFDNSKDELRYNHKPIGDIRYYYEAKTSEGYIAFDGISVWSAYSNKWTTIKSPWLKSIIGWIE